MEEDDDSEEQRGRERERQVDWSRVCRVGSEHQDSNLVLCVNTCNGRISCQMFIQKTKKMLFLNVR